MRLHSGARLHLRADQRVRSQCSFETAEVQLKISSVAIALRRILRQRLLNNLGDLGRQLSFRISNRLRLLVDDCMQSVDG